MRTLLIDNHDSFTYNLFQLLAEVNGVEPIVVRNDEASWEELAGWSSTTSCSRPGPGRPERERDFGVCAEAIRRAEVPLLGVCLGHQGLGWLAGGRVVRAPGAGARPRRRGRARRRAALRRHPRRVRGGPLPLALPGRGRCRPSWRRSPGPRTASLMALAHRSLPQLGRPVPPRVDRHRARPPPARQLPRPHRRPARRAEPPPATVRIRTSACRTARGAAAADADAGRRSRRRAGLRRALRRDARRRSGSTAAAVGRALASPSSATPRAARGDDHLRPRRGGEVTVRRGEQTEVRRESIFDYLERELRAAARARRASSPSTSTAASPATSATS